MTDKITEQAIQMMVDRLMARFDPDQIILFGSQARALTYFADAETAPMPQMIRRVSWPTVKRFLEQQPLTAGRKRLDDLWSA